MNTVDRTEERQLDRLISEALRHEADRLATAHPTSDVALVRLANRVRGERAASRILLARPAAAWLALLLLLAVTAIVVGALVLRELPRNPIVVQPYGLPASCGVVPVADGAPLQAFRDEAVVTIDRSGVVTVLTGNPADAPPASEGPYRGRVESRFVDGVLTPAGIELVLDRVEALVLEPGCYSVRTEQGDSQIFANTADGPIGLHFSYGAGTGRTAPVVGPAEEAALNDLLDSLFELGDWLPPDTYTAIEGRSIQEWILHTTFKATGLAPGDSGELGGVVASADDRYRAVRLPAGASLAEFGNRIPGGSASDFIVVAGYADVRGENQRCGLLDRADAMTLADSLDLVALQADSGPDLYTPDMAQGITVRLHPAVGANSTCQGFAANLNAAVEPSAEAPAPVVGDLAVVDPCSIVPTDLRGKVELAPWYRSSSPFGSPARSCLLEWHHSMTAGGAERILWLYPESLSEEEAESLSTSIFGRLARRSVEGARVWLNDCMAEPVGQLECRWAVAGHSGGYYVVLEIDDRAATVEGSLAALRRVLAAIEP